MKPAHDWPTWVAGRYLRTSRQDSFVRFLSWTAGLGIGLGVAALILALAAMTGLQDAIRAAAARNVDAARVSVGASPQQLTEAERLLAQVVGAHRVSRVVEGNGWLVVGSQVLPLRVVGVQRLDQADAPDRRTPEPDGVRLEGVAASVEPGERVELATARPRVGPLGPEPTVVRVRLEERREGTDPTAVLALETASRLLGIQAVELSVASTGEREPHLTRRIEAALASVPGAEVRGWESLEPGLWVALRLEKVLVFVAVFLIVLVAVLALVADLYLLIADRRHEIGVLRALGARPREIRLAFRRFGLAIAAAGAIGGVIVGVSLAWILDRTGWVRLPGDGYLLEHVPFTVRSLDLLVVTVSSLLLAWLVCLLATGRSGAQSPVKALNR